MVMVRLACRVLWHSWSLLGCHVWWDERLGPLVARDNHRDLLVGPKLRGVETTMSEFGPQRSNYPRNIIICNKCNHQFDHYFKFCPKCGQAVNPAAVAARSAAHVAFGCVLLVVGVPVALLGTCFMLGSMYSPSFMGFVSILAITLVFGVLPILGAVLAFQRRSQR